MHESKGRFTRALDFAWMVAPFAIYLLLVQHLWTDAPSFDDYGLLHTLLRLDEASSLRDQLALLVAQHNEHRLYVLRLVSAADVALAGHLDFRHLILAGNIAFLGALLLMRSEFRDVNGVAWAAAGFLMFQMSYYEAGIWASAGLPNMGAIAFAFAALYLAMRGKVAGPIVFSFLAIGSAANGVFLLPMATAICIWQRRRWHAAVFAVVAAAVFFLYFRDYSRPPEVPSPLVALRHPIDAAQFFLMVVGAVLPGKWKPTIAGVAILAGLAWLTLRGTWRRHPTAAIWVAFLLLSAAAATAGRLGLGLWHASRYAVFSTCLLVIVFLGALEIMQPLSRRAALLTAAGAALTSLAISWLSWNDAQKFSVNAHMLRRPVPVDGAPKMDPYFGMFLPDRDLARRLLSGSEQRGIYQLKPQVVYPSTVQFIEAVPAEARIAGFVDTVIAHENRITVTGWTDLPGTLANRAFSVYSRPQPIRHGVLVIQDRWNVARSLGDASLVFGGFQVELEYESDEAARNAVPSLCMEVQLPGRAPTILGRLESACAVAGNRSGA